MLNKNFSRRSAIQTLGLATAVLVPAQLLAAATPVPPVTEPVCPKIKVKVIMSEISSNHGHAFTSTLEDLVKKGAMLFSIQGSSGHQHGIQITNDVIVGLMQGKTVTLVSTTDAGHSHNAILKIIES